MIVVKRMEGCRTFYPERKNGIRHNDQKRRNIFKAPKSGKHIQIIGKQFFTGSAKVIAQMGTIYATVFEE